MVRGGNLRLELPRFSETRPRADGAEPRVKRSLFGFQEQSSLPGLNECLAEELVLDVSCGAVVEGARDVRHGECSPGDAFGCRHVGEVKNESLGHLEAPAAPGRGNRHVHGHGERVGQAVERESAVSWLKTPSPRAHSHRRTSSSRALGG